MKLSNETKVGLLAIVALAILIFGYNFLKGKNLFGGQHLVSAEYERVDGLLPANPIQLSGLQVGIVDDIYLKKDGSGKVVVDMLLDPHVNVPTDSKVTIVSLGLLGDKGIRLDLGKNNTYVKGGDQLTGEIETDMMSMVEKELLPIKNKVEVMMGSLDSTINSVNTLLGSDELQKALKGLNSTIGSVQTTLKSTNKVITDVGEFTDTDMHKISAILDDAKVLTSQLNSMSSQLKGTMSKVDLVLDDTKKITGNLSTADLKKTVDEANAMIAKLSGIADQVENGDGSVGMLLKDGRLYEDIDKVMANLSSLLADMQAHPKDYVSFSLIERRDRSERKEKKRKKNEGY